MKQKLLIRIGLAIALLTSLAACNEEPEYATTVIKDLGKEVKVLFVNETFSPVASAAEISNLSWESSNESVATVSEDGVITAVGKGKAVIKAIDSENKTISETTIVVVHNQFAIINNGKLVTTFNLDSCMDAWCLSSQVSETEGMYYHILKCYTKSLSSDGYGGINWSGNEKQFLIEIPLLFKHELSDEYTPLNTGSYDIYIGWDFDYIFKHTDLEYDGDWINAWQYTTYGNYPEILLNVKKNGEKYSFTLTREDEYGRQYFLAYNGKIFEQYYD